jgi:hypothetical protein
MEEVGIFLGHLEFIIAIVYILWLFGNLVAIPCIFPHFGTLWQKKSGKPVSKKEEKFSSIVFVAFSGDSSSSLSFSISVPRPIRHTDKLGRKPI